MDKIPEAAARRQPAAVIGQVVVSSRSGTTIAGTSQPVTTILDAVRAASMPLPPGAALPVLVSEVIPVALAALTDTELTAIVPFLNQRFVPIDVLQSAGALVITVPFALVYGRGARRAGHRREAMHC